MDFHQQNVSLAGKLEGQDFATVVEMLRSKSSQCSINDEIVSKSRRQDIAIVNNVSLHF
jgi:hypothetical protein